MECRELKKIRYYSFTTFSLPPALSFQDFFHFFYDSFPPALCLCLNLTISHIHTLSHSHPHFLSPSLSLSLTRSHPHTLSAQVLRQSPFDACLQILSGNKSPFEERYNAFFIDYSLLPLVRNKFESIILFFLSLYCVDLPAYYL